MSFCCTWMFGRASLMWPFLSFSPASRWLVECAHKKGTSRGGVCSVFGVFLFMFIQLFCFGALLNQSVKILLYRQTQRHFSAAAHAINSESLLTISKHQFRYLCQNMSELNEMKNWQKRRNGKISFCPHIFQLWSTDLNTDTGGFVGWLLLLPVWSCQFHLPVRVPCHSLSPPP